MASPTVFRSVRKSGRYRNSNSQIIRSRSVSKYPRTVMNNRWIVDESISPRSFTSANSHNKGLWVVRMWCVPSHHWPGLDNPLISWTIGCRRGVLRGQSRKPRSKGLPMAPRRSRNISLQTTNVVLGADAEGTANSS